MKRGIFFFILILELLLCGCAKQKKPDVVIGTFWNAPVKGNAQDEHDLDWGQSNKKVIAQRQGFLRGLNEFPDLKIKEVPHSEDVSIEELTRSVHEMVQEDKIFMVVGGTTNTGTMHAASNTSFFQIPMLIPYADGDNLIGEENYWTKRLTPSGSDFADFIGSHLMTASLRHELDNILFQDAPVYAYEVNAAIIYEDTTYGEAAALDLGEKLMTNAINLEIYRSYSSGGFFDLINQLNAEQKKTFNALDVIFFINEDADYAIDLEKVAATFSEGDSDPVIIFFGNILPEYSEEAGGVGNLFFVHRAIDFSTCPKEIKTTPEAIGYGAGILTGRVLERTMQNLPQKPDLQKALLSGYSQEYLYLQSIRVAVRKQLEAFDENVPCIGPVHFSSEGANSKLQMESICFQENGETRVVSDTEIINLIAQTIRYDLDHADE